MTLRVARPRNEVFDFGLGRPRMARALFVIRHVSRITTQTLGRRAGSIKKHGKTRNSFANESKTGVNFLRGLISWFALVPGILGIDLCLASVAGIWGSDPRSKQKTSSDYSKVDESPGLVGAWSCRRREWLPSTP